MQAPRSKPDPTAQPSALLTGVRMLQGVLQADGVLDGKRSHFHQRSGIRRGNRPVQPRDQVAQRITGVGTRTSQAQPSVELE